MRRILKLLVVSSLGIVLFAGVVFVPTSAGRVYAADVGDICGPDNTGEILQDGTCSIPDEGTAEATATEAPPAPGGSIDSALVWVMNKIAALFAWLVAVAAITLENVVLHTVVHMGNYVNNLSAIGVTWRIFRDIGNIALLFGFIFVGFCTIINVDQYGAGSRLLPKLLMAAVALNFSLFAAEAVIDVGNLFATQFYTQINGGQPAESASYGGTANEGISNKIMGQLGLQQIYGDVLNERKNAFEPGNSFIIAFLSIILFVIVAFVLFSLAFMLVARFVALVFLIISSPIGVAGLGIPKLEGLARKWWSELVNQTITAPVLLLMLYIALAVITDRQFLSFGAGEEKAPNWTDFLDGNNLAGFANIFLSFAIAMGLLLAVLVVAKRMGAAGADMAMNLGAKASFGAVSFLGRTAIGGGAGSLLSNRWTASAAKNSRMARYMNRTGRLLGNRTYDFRNLKGFEPTVSTLSSALGARVDMGKGATNTARGVQEKYGAYGQKWWKDVGKEAREEEAKAARSMAFTNAQSAVSRAQAEMRNLEAKKRHEEITGDEFKTQMAEQQKNANNSQNVIRAELAKMSNKEIEDLDGIKKGTEALVKNLTPQQFAALMKSDKLSDKQREDVRSARFRDLDALRAMAQTTDEGSGERKKFAAALNGLSKGELELLSAEYFEKNSVALDELSDKNRETLQGSDSRAADERARIKSSSKPEKLNSKFEEFKAANGGSEKAAVAALLGDTAARALFEGMRPDQQAQLDKQLLRQASMARLLHQTTLQKLQDEKKLGVDAFSEIGDAIRSDPTAKAHEYVTKGVGSAYYGTGVPQHNQASHEALAKAIAGEMVSAFKAVPPVGGGPAVSGASGRSSASGGGTSGPPAGGSGKPPAGSTGGGKSGAPSSTGGKPKRGPTS
jgi:hypothetical protein